MHGHGDRFDEGSGIQCDLGGECDERARRHVPERLQGAGRVDADEVEVLADVGVAGEAGGTGSVPGQRHDGDGVADAPPLDAVADRGDRAAHLVAEHEGLLDAGVHVAVQDVQVGAAQSDVRNAQLHLARPGRRGLGLCDRDGRVARVCGGQH